MEHREIRSIAGEDNPDTRAVQEQVRRFTEGLGCRYIWTPEQLAEEALTLPASMR